MNEELPRGVKLCTNDDCRFPTRPSKAHANDFPDTRKRIKGKCSTCHWEENPPIRQHPDHKERLQPKPETLSGLNSFLAGRRAREAAAARRTYRIPAQRKATR